MSLPKEERQKHIDFSAPCVERGGNSTNHRGVLAQYLDTIIPMARSAILAHACNNPKCSNPEHLYWATDRENIVEDGTEFGTFKTAWDRSVEKYGLEEASRRNSRGDKSAGGKAGKGKVLSEEHKEAIRQAIFAKPSRGGGRGPAMDKQDLINTVNELGFDKASEVYGLKKETLKHRYYRYIKS